MHKRLSAIVVSMFVGLQAGFVSAAPQIGQLAPDFSTQDSNGQPHSLKDYKGKYVVLEWFNDSCPFVHKFYDVGSMQKLQTTYKAKGVIWLSIVSSAPGKEGYVTADQANKDVTKFKAAPTAVLLDPTGVVGRLYEAKTTPAMYVIDPSGTLIYKGAIDNRPSTDSADIAGATNYVSAALDASMAHQPVVMSATASYGCGVKYQ